MVGGRFWTPDMGGLWRTKDKGETDVRFDLKMNEGALL